MGQWFIAPTLPQAILPIYDPRKALIVMSCEFPKTPPYFGVLIIRILLFRVLYQGPLVSESHSDLLRGTVGGAGHEGSVSRDPWVAFSLLV